MWRLLQRPRRSIYGNERMSYSYPYSLIRGRTWCTHPFGTTMAMPSGITILRVIVDNTTKYDVMSLPVGRLAFDTPLYTYHIETMDKSRKDAYTYRADPRFGHETQHVRPRRLKSTCPVRSLRQQLRAYLTAVPRRPGWMHEGYIPCPQMRSILTIRSKEV